MTIRRRAAPGRKHRGKLIQHWHYRSVGIAKHKTASREENREINRLLRW